MFRVNFFPIFSPKAVAKTECGVFKSPAHEALGAHEGPRPKGLKFDILNDWAQGLEAAGRLFPRPKADFKGGVGGGAAHE